MPRAIVLVALVAACSSAPAPPESVGLDFFLAEEGLEITRIYPAHDVPRLRPWTLSYLAYELRDRGGEVVVRGFVPDPRISIDEGPGPDGEMEVEEHNRGWGFGLLRLPARSGELILHELQVEGLVEIGRAAFDPGAAPTDGLIARHRASLSRPTILGLPVLVEGGQASESAIDILILPEGFTEEEIPEFQEEVARIAAELFTLAAFSRNDWRLFNLWRQDVASRESGITERGLIIHDDVNNAFGGYRSRGENLLEIPRGGEVAVRDLGAQAGADVVVVLFNDGEGRSNVPARGVGRVNLGRRGNSALVLAHELGHAVLGLADEYGGGGLYCNRVRNRIRNWLGWNDDLAPNVTVSAARTDLPWAQWIDADTELPTPLDAPHEVGAFEGAFQCDRGFFRAERECLMRHHWNRDSFCHACSGARDALTSLYQHDPTGGTCPERWRNDGICDPCLGNDPDCDPPEKAAQACNANGVCEPHLGERRWNCPHDCPAGLVQCGDGVCEGDEDDESCPDDCGCAAAAAISRCDLVAPHGCYCDRTCGTKGDCCADACAACGSC